MALSREVGETLKTFQAPFRKIMWAGVVTTFACIIPALALKDKDVSTSVKLALVAERAALISSVAGGVAVTISSYLLWATKKEREESARCLEVSPQPRFEFSRVAQSDSSNSEMVDLFQQLGESVKKPATCQGCTHYDGHSYGGNRFICAMHPYGWDSENCPDWETHKTRYRIVRVQGAAQNSTRAVFFVIEDDLTRSLDDLIGEGVGIHSPRTIGLLCEKYRLKSVTGLPGCVFESEHSDPEAALYELIDNWFK